jgi:hypothetical protein
MRIAELEPSEKGSLAQLGGEADAGGCGSWHDAMGGIAGNAEVGLGRRKTQPAFAEEQLGDITVSPSKSTSVSPSARGIPKPNTASIGFSCSRVSNNGRPETAATSMGSVSMGAAGSARGI